MAREMRLAVFAAKDFVRVEVGVVNETHAGGLLGRTQVKYVVLSTELA